MFPLDNSRLRCARITPRPSATAGKDCLHLLRGEISGIPSAAHRSILNRSFTITAEVDVPQGGGEGMIVTAGGESGGYGLYLLKGKPVFTYNLLAMRALSLAKHRRPHAGQAHHRLRLHL